ncbi:WbqC family protein [Flagellimonas myxillae]|uniref:WbqC family protein n=1 Tax=Flagellimonas myxillae TaxID=2942214 RepID=UPI00201EC806|nr:WbqC family protein [Muricauda myxillae]MCL6265385.1 WbqC family protein [Muricauda myxillae]
MSKILLHPTYFPSIATFAVMVQKEIIWEAQDNFQKQTYRNRCYICTDQGRHMLNIPIKHVGGKEGRQKYRDVVPDSSTNWTKLHWRTLETAYRTSPFFEFYEDDLRPLFEGTISSLFQFNLKTIQTLGDCLGLDFNAERTTSYKVSPDNLLDARFLVEAKRPLSFGAPEYVQVFGERHDFLPNLSILDLLFNEGPNTVSYLQNLQLDFLNA